MLLTSQQIVCVHALVKNRYITSLTLPESPLYFLVFYALPFYPSNLIIYPSLKSRCTFFPLILSQAFFSSLVLFCDPECAGQRSTLASLGYGSEPVNSGHELWPGVKLCSSHSQCLCLPIKCNVFMLYGIMDKEAL